jgi:hypothetical protein
VNLTLLSIHDDLSFGNQLCNLSNQNAKEEKSHDHIVAAEKAFDKIQIHCV